MNCQMRSFKVYAQEALALLSQNGWKQIKHMKMLENWHMMNSLPKGLGNVPKKMEKKVKR